ncbi:MAG: hypothetical protein JWQ09_5529 [Segetibacter sp.]|nr:hypothetical protein [Segetibacter sp.]
MNTPKRKRCTQRIRLVVGLDWIRNYKGKNIIKGYSKHFGVDKLCAIKELEILGVKISEERKKQITDAYKRMIEERQKKKQEKEEKEKQETISIYSEYSNEEFAFIAGYTSGGAPYGIKWEEQELEDFNREEQNDELPW